LRTAGEKRLAAVLGPMDAAIAQKSQKTFGVADEPIRGRVVIKDDETKGNTSKHKQFKMGAEIMYGGQGKILNKNNLTTNIITMRNNDEHAANASTLSTENGGLDQPLLDYTNREVTGDDTRQLCKQNKKKKQQLKALQHRGSQWMDHMGTVPCDTTPLP
jgi:hypothetical protein